MKNIVVPGQTLVCNSKQASDLQTLHDEIQILAGVIHYLRDTKAVIEKGKDIVTKFEIIPKRFSKETVLMNGISKDNISKHLGYYKSRDLQCFKNVKKRLEDMGYIITEFDYPHGREMYGHRLAWKITKKK